MTALSKSSGFANRMSSQPPIIESPAETAYRSGFPRHWIVLGLLVLAHAVFGAYSTPANRTLVNLTAGVMISHPILLATWAAFARQRFYHRLLWSLLICTYLSFADDLGAGIHGRPGEMILANLALYVVLLGIFLPVCRFSRWQITQLAGKETPSVYLAHHFGIHHMLILTAIVALACGLVRSLLIITSSGTPYSSVVVFIGSLSLLLVQAFPSSVVPWLTLAPGRKPYWLIPITILVAGLLDAIAFAFMIKAPQVPWFPPVGVKWYSYYSVAFPYLWIQLGAILSAIVNTLVLRFCGFRMIREPKVEA